MGMLLRRYHTEEQRTDSVVGDDAEHPTDVLGPEETDSLLAKDPEHPADEAEPIGTAKGGGKPAGNASREDWVEFALSQGRFEGSLEDLTRNEIRDLFEN